MAEFGKVVIAGGTGFLGVALRQELQCRSSEIVVLTRRSRQPEGATRYVVWDAATIGSWSRELEGAEALVNLTGEPIVQKLTVEARARMTASRVEATRVLGAACAACSAPPPAWINASGAGIYGDRADEKLTEASPIGASGFLVQMAKDWEAAGHETALPGTRFVPIRMGMVLGREAGALPVLLKVTRSFLGGRLGSGRQWVSWIHARDLARLMVFAMRSGLAGPVNGVAPNPTRNADFMAELRRAVGRPWSPPAPVFALKLASAFGAPGPDLALQSQRTVPAVALEAGFKFEYPTLREALQDLVRRGPSQGPYLAS